MNPAFIITAIIGHQHRLNVQRGKYFYDDELQFRRI